MRTEERIATRIEERSTVIAPPTDGFVHGQPFTFSSSDIGGTFGTKATAAPVFWDTVDNQAAYAGLSNGNTIPTGPGYPWTDPTFGNSSGDGAIKYNNVGAEQRHARSSACYKKPNTFGRGYLDGNEWPYTGEIYISWWWKIDTDVCTSSAEHSSKWIRLSQANRQTQATMSWTQAQYIIFNQGGGCQTGPYVDYCLNQGGSCPSANAWTFTETWISGLDNTVSWVADNNYIGFEQGWSPGGVLFDQVWKLGWDPGGNNPPSGVTLWMDSIYYDNTFARVMLGNAPTFSACTVLEMQPPTAWNNTSITVTANAGALNGNAYLYVHRTNRQLVNTNGFEVTIQ